MDRLKEQQVHSEWGKLISGNISEEWAFSLLFNLFSSRTKDSDYMEN